MRETVRRIRSSAGQLGLLAAFAALAVAVIVGSPRATNQVTDEGLREAIAALPYQQRDIRYQMAARAGEASLEPDQVMFVPGLHQGVFAPALRRLVDEHWYAIQADPEDISAAGAGLPVNATPPGIGLRVQSGAAEAASLVRGRWPATRFSDGGPLIEAAIAAEVARALDLSLGRAFDLYPTAVGPAAKVRVVIVGVFTPHDPAARIWNEEGELLAAHAPREDGDPWRGVVLTDIQGAKVALDAGFPLTYSWRYRIDGRRLDVSQLDAVAAAVHAARQYRVVGVATTGLDAALNRFRDQLAAVRALQAIVVSGVLATLFGLVLLAARATVEQRGEEFALLGARGAGSARIALRLVTDAALVVSPAAALGFYGGALVPGRPAGTALLAILFGLSAVLAVPVIAMARQRGAFSAPGRRGAPLAPGRRDGARPRRSARRATAEASVLLLAGVGAFLLRRRGLQQETGTDPYLVLVPVLLATGAALLALRAFPAPLRLAGRLAARARGAVAFIGLAGAGRGAPASVGSVAVMVVAVATGAFSVAVATTLDAARDRATNQAVPADALVRGWRFGPRTADRLAEVPGTVAVAPVSINANSILLDGAGRDATSLGRVTAVVVDGPALARVIEASGVDAELPPALLDAGTDTGVAAVVSPAVAATLAATGVGSVEVQGEQYEFRVAAVSVAFPAISAASGRFVVLPLQAIDHLEGGPILPTSFLIAGERLDLDALIAVGDEAQRAWQGEASAAEPEQAGNATTVTTWTQHRRGMERSGANQVLSQTFAIGAFSGSVLALFAVGFAVAAGVRSRGRVLSRLRTMGLSARQGRGMLVYELTPQVGLGALTGALVGATLPPLLGPALGLEGFTDGTPVGLHVDPGLIGATLVLIAAGLGTAVVAEIVMHRRLRLGEVLRLGEEN